MKLGLRTLVLIAATATLPCAASAQWGVGASLTVQRIALNAGTGSDAVTDWVYGPTFSVQHEHGHFVKFGFDARGQFLGYDGVGVRAFDVGPRLAVTAHVLPIKVYGEVLFGGMGARASASQSFTTHFDLQEVVGLDYTVVPHVDWRVLEYAHGNILGLTNIPDQDSRNQFSTGLVVRFF
jgi:hypothetical protein